MLILKTQMQLKFQNNQYTYILILIDCFSRKVWAAPMKKKNAAWAADAFESIFKHFDEFPTHIITDRGLGTQLKFIEYLSSCLYVCGYINVNTKKMLTVYSYLNVNILKLTFRNVNIFKNIMKKY